MTDPIQNTIVIEFPDKSTLQKRCEVSFKMTGEHYLRSLNDAIIFAYAKVFDYEESGQDFIFTFKYESGRWTIQSQDSVVGKGWRTFEHILDINVLKHVHDSIVSSLTDELMIDLYKEYLFNYQNDTNKRIEYHQNNLNDLNKISEKIKTLLDKYS